MAKKKLSRKARENLIGYSFIGIWIIGFVVFMLYPLFTSLVYSLSNVQITGTGIIVTFHGFQNFKNIFQIEEGFNFTEALVNFVFKELIFQLPIILVFSILIAMLLNQKLKGRGFFERYFSSCNHRERPVIKE